MEVNLKLNIETAQLRLANIFAFLLFALFLIVPSAYSILATCLLLLYISTVNKWNVIRQDKDVRKLGYYFFGVSIFWAISFDGWWSWNLDGDLPFKYLMAAVCVLGAGVLRINPRVVIYSFALGCIGAGILAVLQFMEVGKATGYTNAIRFGDISILMGVLTLIFCAVKDFSTRERFFFLFAGCMGIAASFLSLSRGGWPLLLLAPILFIWGFYKEKLNKKRFGIAVCMVCVIGILALSAMKGIPALDKRILAATQETRGYFLNREKYAATSVGARLEQWRISWNLGLEKPIAGWGDQGVWVGRKEYVLNGLAEPSSLKFAHAHNEILEMWARRGILGVLGILLIYAVPIWLFLPREEKLSEKNRELSIALSVAGMMVPVGYFIFGLSEVFFFLNIGNIFYIFTLILLFSSIKWMEKAEK